MSAKLSGRAPTSGRVFWIVGGAVVVLGAGAALLPGALGGSTRRGPTTTAGGCPEGMEYVAGGEFTLGETSKPANVAPFCMHATEVTARAYAACVREGKCNGEGLACGAAATYGSPEREGQPINCVTWEQALAYCTAQGLRLPTEEEWEWAARAGSEGRAYPWGDDPPEGQLCWSGKLQRTGPCDVRTFEGGNTPTRISDLGGGGRSGPRACTSPRACRVSTREGGCVDTQICRFAQRHATAAPRPNAAS